MLRGKKLPNGNFNPGVGATQKVTDREFCCQYQLCSLKIYDDRRESPLIPSSETWSLASLDMATSSRSANEVAS